MNEYLNSFSSFHFYPIVLLHLHLTASSLPTPFIFNWNTTCISSVDMLPFYICFATCTFSGSFRDKKHDYTAHILHIHRVNNIVIKSIIAQLQYFTFFSQFWHFLIMTPASQLVSLHSTTHHPLGLDFRLFKDNPMAFWTSSSTTQFEPPGTLITAVCVNTSQLSRDWPLLLQRNNLDARSGGGEKKAKRSS